MKRNVNCGMHIIKNTKRPDETIDWVMFEQAYYKHSLLGELSSGSGCFRVVMIVLYCSLG
jgi:hypothetical protein